MIYFEVGPSVLNEAKFFLYWANISSWDKILLLLAQIFSLVSSFVDVSVAFLLSFP
jgi:hypothetical protein